MGNDTRKPMTRQEQLDGLRKASIPIDPFGAVFKETTTDLAKDIVDLLVNNFKIQECDHVYMTPVKENGRVVDFEMYLYFNTSRNRDSQNWNIRRVSSKGGVQRTSGGRIDLRGVVGAKMTNGGFEMSDKFRAVMAPIAELNEGNIVVKRDPDYAQVAVIKVDFFSVIGAMVLEIAPDDNYDFEVTGCEPIRGGEGLDYLLTIIKYISYNKGNRSGKSGIDYSTSDMRLSRGANKRR